VGARASGYLNTPEFSAHVMAAGSKAVFLISPEGNILAASQADQGPHPRSFLTDMNLSTLQIGVRLWRENTGLRFSDGNLVSLKDAVIWRRPPTRPSVAAPLGHLVSRCTNLYREALRRHRGENLGLALPLLAKGSDAVGMGALTNETSLFVAAGVERVRELLPACRLGHFDSVLGEAESLIGLGHGLTPSGDDFVGGLLFMAYHLNAAYPGDFWWDSDGVRNLLERSTPMTNQISHALLTDLAEGHSHQALHDLVDGLLTGREPFDAASHVLRVTSIGHSSGWDMLTGMLAGMLPIIDRA
jgi:hypothetical protein